MSWREGQRAGNGAGSQTAMLDSVNERRVGVVPPVPGLSSGFLFFSSCWSSFFETTAEDFLHAGKQDVQGVSFPLQCAPFSLLAEKPNLS